MSYRKAQLAGAERAVGERPQQLGATACRQAARLKLHRGGGGAAVGACDPLWLLSEVWRDQLQACGRQHLWLESRVLCRLQQCSTQKLVSSRLIWERDSLLACAGREHCCFCN